MYHKKILYYFLGKIIRSKYKNYLLIFTTETEINMGGIYVD